MSHTWSIHPFDDAIEHQPGDDCICGPDTIPLPTATGEIWWAYFHHALTAPAMRNRGEYIQELRDWAARQEVA